MFQSLENNRPPRESFVNSAFLEKQLHLLASGLLRFSSIGEQKKFLWETHQACNATRFSARARCAQVTPCDEKSEEWRGAFGKWFGPILWGRIKDWGVLGGLTLTKSPAEQWWVFNPSTCCFCRYWQCSNHVGHARQESMRIDRAETRLTDGWSPTFRAKNDATAVSCKPSELRGKLDRARSTTFAVLTSSLLTRACCSGLAWLKWFNCLCSMESYGWARARRRRRSRSVSVGGVSWLRHPTCHLIPSMHRRIKCPFFASPLIGDMGNWE